MPAGLRIQCVAIFGESSTQALAQKQAHEWLTFTRLAQDTVSFLEKSNGYPLVLASEWDLMRFIKIRWE